MDKELTLEGENLEHHARKVSIFNMTQRYMSKSEKWNGIHQEQVTYKSSTT